MRLLAILALSSAAVFPATRPVVMANAAVRVEAGLTAGKLVERLWAKRESGWTEIAVGEGKTQGSLSITGLGGQPLTGQVQNLAADGGGINIEFSGDGWTVQRTLRFVDDGRWIRVTNTFNSSGAITLHSFKDVYRTTTTPTWAYSPSVGGFNPDGMYKAPLILVQSGKIALGVVPDERRWIAEA